MNIENKLKSCVYDMNSFVNTVGQYSIIYGNFTPDYPYFSDNSLDLVVDFKKKNIEINPLAHQEIYDVVCFSFETEFCTQYGYLPEQRSLEKIAKNFYKNNKTEIDSFFKEKTTPEVKYNLF